MGSFDSRAMISPNQFLPSQFSRKQLAPSQFSRWLCLIVLLSSAAWGQSGKAPSVSMAPVPLVSTQRAAQTKVSLNFRVVRGFHINSNAPKDEFLIPTALK